LVLPEQVGGDVVVAVGEDGSGDCDAVAKEAASRGKAAVELGLDVFDDNALTAFGRFHLVPIIRVHSIVIGSIHLQAKIHLVEWAAGSINPESCPS
jgi:hypothetical protein